MKNLLIIILLSIMFITTGCMKSREINADELYILNYISTDKRLPEKARLLINETLKKDTVRKAEAHILIENAALYVPELEGWIKQYKQKEFIFRLFLVGLLLAVIYLPFSMALGILTAGFIFFGTYPERTPVEDLLSVQKSSSAEKFLQSNTKAEPETYEGVYEN